MNYLYKLVTIKNVEINYDAFKKKELIECLATMRDIYFSLKQENNILRENAEHNDKVVDKVNWGNQLLKKENKQLKSILTKLSEWLKETRINSAFIDEQTIMEVQLKIQELEQGSGINDSN